MAISNYVLTTVPGNIYTSTGNTVVSVMYFNNNDGSAATLNLWAMPADATVANVNYQIYNGILIASGDTYVVDIEKLVLGNGDRLMANASANSAITSTVSYVGI